MAVFISILSVSAADNVSAADDVSAVDNISAADDVYEVDNVSASDGPLKIDDAEDMPISNVNNHGASGIISKVESSDNSQDALKGRDLQPQVPKKAITKNIKTTYGKKAKYTLKLTDQNGKIIAGKQVKFKIGKKIYRIKTDSKGIATLKLNYAAGKYKIKYFVGDLFGKNTYTVKNAVSLKILKWGNKADISKLEWLKNNMPNNKWVKKAVKAAKKGNPLLKFQGGKGKKVFIIAGVHGNELSSQVAAMKLIKYLTDHPIRGTVYIIPFVNIKAISYKVRDTGVDFNRVAPKKGTLSNNIVKLVVKYKCDCFGDLHTTQPGGLPGDNIVMGSKSPTAKSASLCNYIAKYAKVHKRIYKYAGQEYPTAFQDTLNRKGVPSVVCEVRLPHNTLTAKTVKTSLAMAKCILKFNSVI